MIAPEVRAAALLAREGRGRDEPGERVRIVEQAPQPFRVAVEARVAPDRLARGAGGRLHRARGRGGALLAGRGGGGRAAGLGAREAGAGRSVAEDEALRERVRRESVG